MTICHPLVTLFVDCGAIRKNAPLSFYDNVAVVAYNPKYLRIFASPLRERGQLLGGRPSMAHGSGTQIIGRGDSIKPLSAFKEYLSETKQCFT